MKPAHYINEIDLFVGNRLRQIRKSQKISMNKLATYLGRTWQQITKYETGQNRISAGVLWQITYFLNCSVSDFFPDTPILSKDFTKENRQKTLIRMKCLLDNLIDEGTNKSQKI